MSPLMTCSALDRAFFGKLRRAIRSRLAGATMPVWAREPTSQDFWGG